MKELDLTLLTDEERLTYEQNNDPRVAMLSWGQVHKLFSALIAARAENKRLRECLRNIAADGDPQFAAAGERPFAMPMTPGNEQAKDLWLYIGGVHRRAKAALLQSEKESE